MAKVCPAGGTPKANGTQDCECNEGYVLNLVAGYNSELKIYGYARNFTKHGSDSHTTGDMYIYDIPGSSLTPNKYLNHTILSFTTSPSYKFYGDVVFDGKLSVNSIKTIINNKEYTLFCMPDSFFNVTDCYFNSNELMFNAGESVKIIFTE